MKIRQYLCIQVPKTFLDHCLLLSDHFYLEQEGPNFTTRSVYTLQQLSTAVLQIFLRTNTKNKTKMDVVCNIQQKSARSGCIVVFCWHGTFVGTQKIWSIRRATKEEHKLYLLAHIHWYFLSYEMLHLLLLGNTLIAKPFKYIVTCSC